MELAMLILASFAAVTYGTVCNRKLGRSLGTWLAIATTHLYDWVHRLITN